MSSLAVTSPSVFPARSCGALRPRRIFGVEFRKNFITKRGFLDLPARAGARCGGVDALVHHDERWRGDQARYHATTPKFWPGFSRRSFCVRPCTSDASGSSRTCSAARWWSARLHFYFLAPVRRDVLVAGKYLAGLMTSIVLLLRKHRADVRWILRPLPGFRASRRFCSMDRDSDICSPTWASLRLRACRMARCSLGSGFGTRTRSSQPLF